MRNIGDAVHEALALIRRHIGAEHHQRLMRQFAVMAIGVDDVIDQFAAITAAAGGDEKVIAFRPMRYGFGLRLGPLQETDEIHLVSNGVRNIEPRQRIMEIWRAIDPDMVIELADLGHDIVTLPLGFEQLRRIHDIAQADDELGALSLEISERFLHLAAQAHGLLVDDEDIRLEAFSGVIDDGAAHLQRFLKIDMPVHRGIFTVAQFDDARDFHEIDAGAIIEGAGNRRT
ncbi:hypothetical protein D3C71_737570 [compost metagenome]